MATNHGQFDNQLAAQMHGAEEGVEDAGRLRVRKGNERGSRRGFSARSKCQWEPNDY